MSQINYKNIALIVENNLRSVGLSGGNLESGWKENIVINNKTYNQQFNLQNLRDVIAKSIVQALTEVEITGNLSIGNVPGSQIMIDSDLSKTSPTVAINYNPEETLPVPIPLVPLSKIVLSDKSAVRVGDSTQINATSDPIFITLWSTILTALYTADSAMPPVFGGTIASYLNSQYGGPPNPTDIYLNGICASGSSSVKIGD